MGVKSSGKLVPIIWQKILPHNIHNIINSTEENMIMAKLNCCCDSSIQDVVHLKKVHSGKVGVNNLEKRQFAKVFGPTIMKLYGGKFLSKNLKMASCKNWQENLREFKFQIVSNSDCRFLN